MMKKIFLACGLVTKISSGKTKWFYYRTKKNGNENGKSDEKIVAIIDNLLEYKRVTSSHNQKNT